MLLGLYFYMINYGFSQAIPAEIEGTWEFQFEITAFDTLFSSNVDIDELNISFLGPSIPSDSANISELKNSGDFFESTFMLELSQQDSNFITFTNLTPDSIITSTWFFLNEYLFGSSTFNWTTTSVSGVWTYLSLESPDHLVLNWLANCNASFCVGEIHFARAPLSSIFSPPNHLDGWEIYPNPARDILVLNKVNGQSSVATSAKIFSSSGLCLKEVKNISTTQSIDLEELPVGFYLIRIEEEEGYSLKKFIISR